VRKPDGKPAALGEIGDRDGYGTGSTDHDLRQRQHRLNKYVHRALAWAHVLSEAHTVAFIAGGDALLFQDIARPNGNQASNSVGERIARSLENRGPRAATADPAGRDRTIRQDQRFGARLGRGGRDRAHNGCQREGLAV
jgi:hypothetical protein